MLTHHIVMALNDLLRNADQAVAGTSYVVARKGAKENKNNRGVVCATTNPLLMSIYLTIKDGLEELAEGEIEELTQSQLVTKLKEKLRMCLSLLDCENIQRQD